MTLIHIYKTPGPCTKSLLKNIQQRYSCNVEVKSEFCYNISCSKPLTVEELERLKWILAESMSVNSVFEEPQLQNDDNNIFIEVGPRMNFATPFSTNAVSICHSIGLSAVLRIELSRCYMLKIDGEIPSDIEQDVYSLLYDRMTEMRYKTKLTSFDVNITPEQVYEIDIMRRGCEALEEANSKLGLAFDAWDLDYYTELFTKQVGRNPTSVECFDLAQSNSEHSRHWFFKGRMVMDGVEKEKCLMQLVSDTQLHSNNNNVIAFSDNSSAIQGFKVTSLLPQNSTESSDLKEESLHRHIIFTAETHNFPTGVAPFPGATTGTGGRIRDVQAAGRGAHVIAGTAGYCFGNLNIPGYKLAWEDSKLKYPSNFALPLQVAIEASNGASDYGNKFGEPVITGFARSFGMLVNDETAERIEWIKPIMFSGGIGSIEANHVNKHTPEPGMKVVKVGGPVYRIGVGGGAASSIQVQGDNAEELDYGAVQRGDAEMEQKMNRVVRACIEMGEKNPIKSIHDQGAGGNGNVLKEISEPAGAVIHAEQFRLGDPTLSLMEVWGAEYQESNALLVEARDQLLLEKIARREKCDVSFVGHISGDGRVVFKDETSTQPAFDLPLDVVLGKMPQKVFQLSTKERKLFPLKIPQNLSIIDALDRVLRLPSVASKRYLTNKVDRSVTGLVAQQQCVGPLHTPLADVGVVALSHFDVKGAATAIGEQPIKCLLDARKGAHCTVAEAFTNLVFAKITNIKDVKCSGNWMWPAKLEGEGSRLYEACEAMCEMLSQLGAAVDGGKDSLSMAARLDDAVVKSPGSLVVSLYAPSPDVRARVTPELKGAGNHLLYVKWSGSKEWRLGGSALAQVYNQLGDQCPDVNNFELFSHAFTATQQLIGEGLIVSGHDVSDGGLITTLLEMAFASGNLSFSVDQVLPESQEKRLAFFFAEEPAIVLEVAENNVERLKQVFMASGVSCVQLGMVTDSPAVILENTTLVEDIKELHRVWEATSFQLERLQCNVDCVEEEEKSLFERNAHPQYHYSFTVQPPPTITSTFNVAIIREEGSNGDREMASAFHMAGFRVHDVTMSDLCHGSVTLEQFVGLAFVGGFSYADVLGSAKGWASVAKFNQRAKNELERFRLRPDTFSLGVCNGCQLMALLGWVGGGEGASPPKQQVCFDHNKSGRFESRFSSVRIDKTPSIMLRGMEGACLGVWVAHGEGRIRGDALEALNQQQLVAIRYVDDAGKSTESYPMNPNGSPAGVASLCSMDGRHLAMMPHPERCTQMWQWAWSPPTWKGVERSPWLQMFYNAHKWCESNR